ncbi:MAG: hypothetical protein PHG16_08385 [Lachnospiraceae bacterium]|nr:hypothetical protein [Lachnospiraceae bacterium]
MKNKKRFSVILSALILTVSIVPCFGASTQEKLSDAQAQKQTTESTLQDTQSRIDQLESMKGQSEEYLSELNQQLTDLTNSLQQLQQQAEEKQQELVNVQQELEDAKAQEEKQYSDMKLRIQYMYENSTSGYVEMLFSSENFSDFLSRAQNMLEINKYDRNMLSDYQDAKAQVEEKENQVIAEQDAIAELQKQSAAKQTEVQELYEATYDQIREYTENIDNAESEANTLLSQINQQEDSINQLLAQAMQEEIARQQAAQEAAAAKAAADAQAAAQAANQAAAETKASSSSSSDSQTGSSAGSSTPAGNTQEAESTQPPADNTSSSQGTYLGRFKLTAYCPCPICCGQWSGGNTASGSRPVAGRTIAMAGVPFGTKLSINGTVYTVEDRGTAYGHVDVFMASHSEALQFGLQYADVYQVG